MNGQSKMMRALGLGWGLVLAGFLQGCMVATATPEDEPVAIDAAEMEQGDGAAALPMPASAVDFNTYFSPPQTREAVRAEPRFSARSADDTDNHAALAVSKASGRGVETVPSAERMERLDEIEAARQFDCEPPPNPWRSGSMK